MSVIATVLVVLSVFAFIAMYVYATVDLEKQYANITKRHALRQQK